MTTECINMPSRRAPHEEWKSYTHFAPQSAEDELGVTNRLDRNADAVVDASFSQHELAISLRQAIHPEAHGVRIPRISGSG